MPRSRRPFLLPLAVLVALAAPPGAHAWSDRDFGVVTGQRDIRGAGSVGAALQSQVPGFIARTGVTFDIPADPNPGFASHWDRLETSRRTAAGKAEASVTLSRLPWFVPFWQSARVEASFDPQAAEGAGRVAAVLSRGWSLVGLSGSVEDRYAVMQDGLLGAQAPVTRWEIGRSTRLQLPWGSTALLIGSQFSSTDRLLTGSVGVEQTLFGPLQLSASFIDLGTPQPGARISAGFKLSW